MQKPPPPKPKGPDDLAEVERALSVLKGRHPEHERVRREEEEAKARRRATIDAQSKIAHKEETIRRARFVAIGAGVVVVLGALGFVFRREASRRTKLEE